VPYRRKKLTFAISSPDEFLLHLSNAIQRLLWRWTEMSYVRPQFRSKLKWTVVVTIVTVISIGVFGRSYCLSVLSVLFFVLLY